MPNNNTEATTHVSYSAGTAASAYSYSSLSFSELYEVEDQIEVIRVFPTSLVSELVSDAPDGKEVQSLYTLPNLNKSGSPTYLVDTVGSRIILSPNSEDYVWKNGQHHNRGADIALPVHDHTRDQIIIRRKTYSGAARINWTVGTKVTASLLNAASEQALFISQELRTVQLNPLDFNHWLGAANGLCPLDPNGVIPLKHISTELGGQGVLSIDLSNNYINELKDVTTSSPENGEILTWDSSSSKWVNSIPFAKTFDLTAAGQHNVLKWNSTTSSWALEGFGIDDMANVNLTSSNLQASSILFYDSSTAEWVESDVVLHSGVLTNDHVLTWNATTNKWEARVRPDVTYQVFNLNEASIYDLADVSLSGLNSGGTPAEGDCLAWVNALNTWRDKSVDTWDLNNWWQGDADSTNPLDPGYSAGWRHATLFKYYNTGWVPFWDPRLKQKDYYGDVQNPPWGPGGRGSFHVGPIFAGARRVDGTVICDFDVADQYEVVRWKKDNTIGNHWQLAPMNLNHLGDVRARVYTSPQASNAPSDGDVLVWSNTGDDYSSAPSWIVASGPATVPTSSASKVTTTFNFSTLTDANDNNWVSDEGAGFIGEDAGPLWLETYMVAHNRLRFHEWYLSANGPSKARVRLYKATFANWGTPNNWVNLTDNTSSLQNEGNRVLGWGQGNSTNAGPKKKKTKDNFVMDTDFVDDGEMIIVLLENFYYPGGTAATTLSLSVNWTIE